MRAMTGDYRTLCRPSYQVDASRVGSEEVVARVLGHVGSDMGFLCEQH